MRRVVMFAIEPSFGNALSSTVHLILGIGRPRALQLIFLDSDILWLEGNVEGSPRNFIAVETAAVLVLL